MFLGVDGGGTKTDFLLIDAAGRTLATHTAGPTYYLEVGWDAMRATLSGGLDTVARRAGIAITDLDFAFLGLPAHGEDATLLPAFDAVLSSALSSSRYRCGNDAVCGWAGALACEDGINVVAGTGSIAYGEYQARTARAGGWGELFSDEGSAYWLAREALTLFSRMADGRTQRGALYDIVRTHFGVHADLDICAAVYGNEQLRRSGLAALAPLVAEAAAAGDEHASALFVRAADELAQMVHAVARQLQIPSEIEVAVSYTGGMFRHTDSLLKPLQMNFARSADRYRLNAPRLTPVAGAALYAAKLSGAPLNAAAVATLTKTSRAA